MLKGLNPPLRNRSLPRHPPFVHTAQRHHHKKIGHTSWRALSIRCVSLRHLLDDILQRDAVSHECSSGSCVGFVSSLSVSKLYSVALHPSAVPHFHSALSKVYTFCMHRWCSEFMIDVLALMNYVLFVFFCLMHHTVNCSFTRAFTLPAPVTPSSRCFFLLHRRIRLSSRKSEPLSKDALGRGTLMAQLSRLDQIRYTHRGEIVALMMKNEARVIALCCAVVVH